MVESGGRLDGNGAGYSAGLGPGAGSGSQGGSYASLGGNAVTGKYHGSLYVPRYPGSGGGSGAGGSWINVTAGGYVKIDGLLTVNGATGYGAGSGGSLTITTSLLVGYGLLASNGGDSGEGVCFMNVLVCFSTFCAFSVKWGGRSHKT